MVLTYPLNREAMAMRRREFISGLGSAAAWPVVARAQESKLATIGFLGTVTESAWAPWTAAFVRRLRELGWIEGRNVAIEFRWANERTERFAEIAAEFVRLKVDVIVTASTPPCSRQNTQHQPFQSSLPALPTRFATV
jgi:putative ABC transport system substrate-binding protein